jgi:sugar lactone lactonase YvrE
MRNRSFVSSFRTHKLTFGFILSALFATGFFLLTPLAMQAQSVQYKGSPINFGSVNVGQSGKTYSLAFSFTASAHVGSVAVLTQGATGKDFLSTGGTCKTGSYGSGASCTVNVVFLPLAPGARPGAVVLYDTSTPSNALATAYIYGTGVGPSVAFGPGIVTTKAANASSWALQGVALDGAGKLYFTDISNDVVRKLTPGGTVTTVAGSSGCETNSCFSGDGGPATSAQLTAPNGVAVDGAGNLYIADGGNGAIRKVTPGGKITTAVGRGSGCSQQTDSLGDGCPATSAILSNPSRVLVDDVGDLYISESRSIDFGNGVTNDIRKVTSGGTITKIAGGNECAYSGNGGPATSASLCAPSGMALDGAGNLYIADSGNEVIRKVTPSGTITTVAGDGTGGYSGDDSPATSAELNIFYGAEIALDGAGNLYLDDSGNNVIRKVTQGGTITTVAGNGTQGYTGDGGPAASAEFDSPFGLALDGAGNLYIADAGNSAIRKVDVSDAPSLTFPTTDVGYISPSQNVVIENLGNAALDVTRISTAANFILGGSLTSCNSRGQLLPPAASCILGIEFAPQETGTITGSVTLTDNALNVSGASQHVKLSGTGQCAKGSHCK